MNHHRHKFPPAGMDTNLEQKAKARASMPQSRAGKRAMFASYTIPPIVQRSSLEILTKQERKDTFSFHPIIAGPTWLLARSSRGGSDWRARWRSSCDTIRVPRQTPRERREMRWRMAGRMNRAETENAMSAAVGDTLPLAVAIAISPLAIIAIIMILLSRRARSNGLAYLLGWVTGLAIAVIAILALVGLLSLSPGGDGRPVAAALKLLVGVTLLAVGVRQWRKRVKPGQEPGMPRWMSSIDTFTPAQAFGLAALLSSVSNIALILAAGLDIGRANLSIGQEIGAVVIFIVIASLTVGAAVLYHFFAHERASLTLDSWKVWLLANNAALTTALLAVVGTLLIGKGISGLGLLG